MDFGAACLQIPCGHLQGETYDMSKCAGVYNGHQRIDGRKVQADTEPGGKATNGHFVPAVTHGKLLTAAELQEVS